MLLAIAIILTLVIGLVLAVFHYNQCYRERLTALKNVTNVEMESIVPESENNIDTSQDPVEKVFETEHKCSVELSNGTTIVCRARTVGEGDFDEISDFMFWYEQDRTFTHKLSLPGYDNMSSSVVVFSRGTIVSITYSKQTYERFR